MPVLLLCLLLGLVPVSQADLAAARVNGVEISVTRLEHYFVEYLQEQGRAVASIRSPSLYKRLRDQALDELIDKELLWQQARRRGIVVSDEAVSARLGELERAFGSPAEFERRLAEAGFDRAGYADYTRHEMAAQQVYAQLTAIEEPTEAQVEAFYQANKERVQGMQNQNGQIPVERKQGMAWARAALVDQLQAQARQTARHRLREGANVERAGR